MEYKSLRPTQVLLDPQNPRLPDGTSNDREAINRLIAEGYNQMLALARDLVDRGEGNPTELPIVVKDGSKYVVLEGNRRFAVLKLLGDPKLADKSEHQAAFERIKKNDKAPPKSLFCAIATDRAEADPWITLRHTGANDGVGVRVWSAEQNARHRQRMKAPIDSGTVRSIVIADELTEAYQADTALVDVIKKVRTEKLTNIGRFFSGVTLTRMQLVMKQVTKGDAQTLWARHTADQLHPFFTWAFHYLNDKSVDGFKNDTLRGNLLNDNAGVFPDAASSLPDYHRLADLPYSSANSTLEEDESYEAGAEDSEATGGQNKTHSESANSSEAQDEASAGTGNGSSAQARSNKRDKKDERSIFSDVKLPNLSSNIQRLLREVKLLPVEENYAIACVLARVILELSVSDAKVLAWSGSTEGASLSDKINACIQELDPNIASKKRTRQDLMQAHLETTGIGVVYLHQFMHNPSTKHDAQLARRFSSAFTPLLNSINEAVR